MRTANERSGERRLQLKIGVEVGLAFQRPDVIVLKLKVLIPHRILLFINTISYFPIVFLAIFNLSLNHARVSRVCIPNSKITCKCFNEKLQWTGEPPIESPKCLGGSKK